MARKTKQTVDYFPHPCKNGTKMFIMERKYGVTGYAAYYKLLEQIGAAEGHFIDFNNAKDFAFFQSSIGEDAVTTNQILDTLVEIGALDAPLWNDNKIIFCQDFIDNVADLYGRRKVRIPDKQIIYDYINGINNDLCLHLQEEHGHTDNINPQSKVKYSKVNQSKVNKSIPPVNEFIDYCRTLPINYTELEFSLITKFETWLDNGWRDGYGAKILNWKNKIKSTIPYLQPMRATNNTSVAEKLLQIQQSIRLTNE